MTVKTFEEEFLKNNSCVVTCYATAAGLEASAAIPVAMPAVGFAAQGIVRGSLAAAWHSRIGNAVKASLFYKLQSLRARYSGAFATKAATVIGLGAASAVAHTSAQVCDVHVEGDDVAASLAIV